MKKALLAFILISTLSVVQATTITDATSSSANAMAYEQEAYNKMGKGNITVVASSPFVRRDFVSKVYVTLAGGSQVSVGFVFEVAGNWIRAMDFGDFNAFLASGNRVYLVEPDLSIDTQE